MPKKMDITGQTFGRLTIMEMTDKRAQGSVVYKCKCECGNEVEKAYNRIIHDKVRSCGCLKRGPKKREAA